MTSRQPQGQSSAADHGDIPPNRYSRRGFSLSGISATLTVRMRLRGAQFDQNCAALRMNESRKRFMINPVFPGAAQYHPFRHVDEALNRAPIRAPDKTAAPTGSPRYMRTHHWNGCDTDVAGQGNH
jgi:hypothetical protein